MDYEYLNVLAIIGSLRKDSFNRRLVAATETVAPPGIDFTIADISEVPLYNDDIYAIGFPASVETLRQSIEKADAVLIATPEYNGSIPGVLKNAIDWVSRPPDQPFKEKPVALFGASPGRLGTVKAQIHLRQVLTGMGALILPKPEVYISGVADVLAEDSSFSNDRTAEFVTRLLVALRNWTYRLRT